MAKKFISTQTITWSWRLYDVEKHDCSHQMGKALDDDKNKDTYGDIQMSDSDPYIQDTLENNCVFIYQIITYTTYPSTNSRPKSYKQ